MLKKEKMKNIGFYHCLDSEKKKYPPRALLLTRKRDINDFSDLYLKIPTALRGYEFYIHGLKNEIVLNEESRIAENCIRGFNSLLVDGKSYSFEAIMVLRNMCHELNIDFYISLKKNGSFIYKKYSESYDIYWFSDTSDSFYKDDFKNILRRYYSSYNVIFNIAPSKNNFSYNINFITKSKFPYLPIIIIRHRRYMKFIPAKFIKNGTTIIWIKENKKNNTHEYVMIG